MTVEAIILIGVEKVWMIFPSLSQKLERFYKSVVEEALLGKDPDVAEDFTGGAVNMEKVVRQRQRDEICGALQEELSTKFRDFFIRRRQDPPFCLNDISLSEKCPNFRWTHNVQPLNHVQQKESPRRGLLLIMCKHFVNSFI